MDNSKNLQFDFVNIYSFDLVLTDDKDLDFEKGSLAESYLITDDLTFYYDFAEYSDVNNITSLYNYTGRTSSGFTISDLGLCGVDTGYMQNITGDTVTFTTGSTLLLKPVTGSTYNYNLSFENDTYIHKSYLSLDGGFYQGFYKLYDYPYLMLPNRTEEGFTLNFWLNPQEVSTNTNSLNSIYPENKGFFFFMGSRSENKFHNIIDNETGKTTSENTLISPVTGDTSLISTGLTYDTGTTVNDVNGIGFFYKDNKLGYKSVIVRKDISGNTLTSIKEEETPLIFTGDTENSWINVTIIFKRNQRLTSFCADYIEECTSFEDIPDTQKGKLTFLVNGRPVYKTMIEEPIFRELELHRSKQQGVPFNISIGGGTQGLLESITFDGVDSEDTGLFMEREFSGSFIGGISVASMYSRPLTIPEIIRNYYTFKDIYRRPENFGGSEIIINSNLTK